MFKTSSDTDFTHLSAKNQYDEFAHFEARMRPFMDERVYPELGWTIKRTPERGNIHRDLIANDGKENFDVEEKFRTSIWGDCAIELIQDATYFGRLKEEQVGWFYTSTSRYLIYAFARGMDAVKPSSAYIVSFNRLRAKFNQLIESGFNQKIIKSSKGVGLSFSVGFDWEDLLIAEVARKII